jgi:glucokinase
MPKPVSDKPVIGVDLGGTKVLAGVVAPDGKILGTAKRATKPETGVEDVVERIVKTAREAAREAGLELKDVGALCSAAPGALNPDEGVVRFAPNMANWLNVPFARLLSDQLGSLPVFIENDGNLGALGEHALGAAQGYKDVLGIFVGTGIGGGLVLDGRVWRGSHKTAVEIGHVVLMADGPVCGCGNRGCAEALASRTAIERDIWAGIRSGRETMVAELVRREQRDRLTSGILAAAYAEHDPLVMEVLWQAQRHLGQLVGSMINFIDPQIVVMGGGVVEAIGEAFVAPIRPIAYQHTMNKLDAREIGIVVARLGDHSTLMGAAVHARQQLQAR